MWKKIVTTILSVMLAMWITVEPPTDLCRKAEVLVENGFGGYLLALASIEEYEWGYYWKVYKDLKGPMMRDSVVGTCRDKKEALERIYFQLYGGKWI